MHPYSLSLVLPCYNEEANIADTVHDVAKWMQSKNIEGEIIVVNDGSKDQSAAILSDLQKEVQILKVVTLEKNKGYGLAIIAGLDTATKEIIGFMDSDKQFHIQDIEALLPHLTEVPFVTGRRKKRADPFIRNLFGKILGILTWSVFGLWVRDINCGMKILKRDIWQQIRPTHSVEKLFNTELFLNLRSQNITWMQVAVPHYPRIAGNPTGASAHVILRMFHELWELYRAQSLRK